MSTTQTIAEDPTHTGKTGYNLPPECLHELALQGWTVAHDLPFLDNGQPDQQAVLEISRLFGEPSTRDGGKAVWPVRPVTSQADATFSVRDGEAALHTDSQYHDEPEDLICMFAVRPATDGGTSCVLPVEAAITSVLDHPNGPAILERLVQPGWSWQVPAVFGGNATSTPTRVLRGDGSIRWRADNLAATPGADGMRVAGQFAECLASAPDTAYVHLEPGDLMVLDNRRVLHGRTAFTDRHRLMLRVRLRAVW
ncbi:Fe(II)-2OG oxygenase family protein [Flindersiella endophytica]